MFAANGYERTTIEQIADAADISPRTFFRYFPTKEDVVLWDEYDALIPELLARRPANEPPGETMRAITRQSIEALYEHDPDRLLARHRLLVHRARAASEISRVRPVRDRAAEHKLCRKPRPGARRIEAPPHGRRDR